MQFTNRNWSSFPILGILVAMPFSLLAQTPPVPTPPPDGPTAPSKQKSDTPPAAKPTPPVKPGTPKPYKEVVTAEAKSDEGMFTVHRIDDKILFEIPANLLGREMVWNTEIAKLPAGVGYGGTAVGTKAIRWTRRNNTIFLKTIDYSTRAETNGAIKRAIEDATVDPIIQAFPVEAEGKDKSAVIDVTRLLTSDPQDFAAKGSLGASGVDPTRSYVERFKSFPNNVEIRSLMTFQTTGGGGLGSIFGGPRRRGGNSSSATAVIHYSIALLPEKPMMGRLRDSRVGFFAENFEDYGTDENGVKTKQFIARYRLEKKDPKAALSEPVKPIVYYVDAATPAKWVPYIMKGVEKWQAAFEEAGFRNAIIAKRQPTDDPKFSPEDARYSVIRWLPSTRSVHRLIRQPPR